MRTWCAGSLPGGVGRAVPLRPTQRACVGSTAAARTHKNMGPVPCGGVGRECWPRAAGFDRAVRTPRQPLPPSLRPLLEETYPLVGAGVVCLCGHKCGRQSLALHSHSATTPKQPAYNRAGARADRCATSQDGGSGSLLQPGNG